MTWGKLLAGPAAAAAVMLSLASPAHAAGETNIDHVQVSEEGTVSLVLSVDGLPSGTTPDLDSVTYWLGDAFDRGREAFRSDAYVEAAEHFDRFVPEVSANSARLVVGLLDRLQEDDRNLSIGS